MEFQNKKKIDMHTNDKSLEDLSLINDKYVDEIITSYIEFVNELVDFLNSEKENNPLLHNLNNYATSKVLENLSKTNNNKLKISFLNKIISLIDTEHELPYQQIKYPKLFFILCFLLGNEHFIKDKESDKTDNTMDQRFIMLADKVIEENLGNPDFNTIIWSKELGIGRTFLFKKIKQITGMTPNDYIMRMKMKKSLALMANHTLSITKISNQLGFRNPAYFSKCLKKQFGTSPANFRKTQ